MQTRDTHQLDVTATAGTNAQRSPVVEHFGYFVPASSWDNFTSPPAHNALHAVSDSPLSSSPGQIPSSAMPFAEQPDSSRLTVPSNAPVFLSPAQPIPGSLNQGYTQSNGYNVQPHPSPSIQVNPINAPRPVAPSRRTSSPSPGSSLPSPGDRAPRAIPLHRGEACLHCRKRKMRCDAMKPSCGPCMTYGKECEYEISLHLRRIQQLQDEAVMLRARIAELEGRSPAPSPSSVSPLSAQSHLHLQPQAPPGGHPPTADLHPHMNACAQYSPYEQQRSDVW